MSAHSIEEGTVPARPAVSPTADSGWRGALIGLVPLGLLVAAIVVTVLLTALPRLLISNGDFYAQQQASEIILIAGLALSLGLYVVALWRVLRMVRIWQQVGAMIQGRAALWALTFTALVVVVPLIVALLIPQHPAP
jgi:hypothetical protein